MMLFTPLDFGMLTSAIRWSGRAAISTACLPLTASTHLCTASA
jgi:hypothetical protein